jgi:hypothetical protein
MCRRYRDALVDSVYLLTRIAVIVPGISPELFTFLYFLVCRRLDGFVLASCGIERRAL